MILYIGIILFLIIFSFGSVRYVKQRTILKISVLILGLLATFRNLKIGNDTKSYYELFKSICTMHDYHSMTWRFEIGYLWLNKAISYLTNNFTVFLGIINVFIYVVYYFFIKRYSKNYMMSVFLFFTLGIWGNTLNIIRLELAIAVALLSFMIIDSGKMKKKIGIGLAFVPVTFQRISIVYVLEILVPKKINKSFFKYSFAIALVLSIILPSIINLIATVVPYFSEFYLQNGSIYSIDGIKLASIINMLMALFVFLFGYIIYTKCNKVVYQEEGIALQINMVWVSFLVLLVSVRFNLIDRCSYFFWTFAIVLIPNVCSYVKEKNNRMMLKFIIILLCIIYFIVTTIYRPEWNCIYPYRTIFCKE